MHIQAGKEMLGCKALAFKVRVTVVEFVYSAPLFITIAELVVKPADILQLSTESSKPINTNAAPTALIHFLIRKMNPFVRSPSVMGDIKISQENHKTQLALNLQLILRAYRPARERS
jgi:hypothetical protein